MEIKIIVSYGKSTAGRKFWIEVIEVIEVIVIHWRTVSSKMHSRKWVQAAWCTRSHEYQFAKNLHVVKMKNGKQVSSCNLMKTTFVSWRMKDKVGTSNTFGIELGTPSWTFGTFWWETFIWEKYCRKFEYIFRTWIDCTNINMSPYLLQVTLNCES